MDPQVIQREANGDHCLILVDPVAEQPGIGAHTAGEAR